MSGEDTEPLSDRMYRVQTELVKKLADRSSCVIVGRCADYILGDYSSCIHVFIHAFKEDRIRRISRIYKLTEKAGVGQDQTDGSGEETLLRSTYRKRLGGSIESHQILFNASLMGVEGIVDALEAIYRSKEKGV